MLVRSRWDDRVRPKTVIVTSQYAIEDCFKKTAERDAIARRFRVYQIAPLDDPTACASAIAPVLDLLENEGKSSKKNLM